MEFRVNNILLKADGVDIPHIPQAEKDSVKTGAMTELKKIKDVHKKAKSHDWTQDFTANTTKIQDEYMEIERKWMDILNKPKPTPKKEEKEKEKDKKKEDKKDDMKDAKEGESTEESNKNCNGDATSTNGTTHNNEQNGENMEDVKSDK